MITMWTRTLLNVRPTKRMLGYYADIQVWHDAADRCIANGLPPEVLVDGAFEHWFRPSCSSQKAMPIPGYLNDESLPIHEFIRNQRRQIRIALRDQADRCDALTRREAKRLGNRYRAMYSVLKWSGMFSHLFIYCALHLLVADLQRRPDTKLATLAAVRSWADAIETDALAQFLQSPDLYLDEWRNVGVARLGPLYNKLRVRQLDRG